MFNVKHITLAGYEFLWETESLSFQPAMIQRSSDEPDSTPRRVSFTPSFAGAENVTLEGGTVFVMNRYGKTVSRYDLGASMIPLGAGAVKTDHFSKPDDDEHIREPMVAESLPESGN